MKASEAIEIIRIAATEVEWNYPMNYAIAFETAIAALEKQVPKKPLDKTMEYNGDYGKCPCCGRTVSDYDELKRCSDCGQALDWSDYAESGEK